MNNPFRRNTKSYIDFKKMSDLKWHCSHHDLVSAQAKTWQVWRQEKGIYLKKDGNKFYKKIFCETCGKTTVFRGLQSTDINPKTIKRSPIPKSIRKRAFELLGSRDFIDDVKTSKTKLELDHREPQVRWEKEEKEIKSSMTDQEIEEKFMFLKRSNNLKKSRICENCKKTNMRGYPVGLVFFYQGDERYDQKNKCNGCFYFDPDTWRKALLKK
jgi:hypothetical protein